MSIVTNIKVTKWQDKINCLVQKINGGLGKCK